MANACTQRELRHLGIDDEVEHIVATQGRQLRRRVVPPVPPTQTSSAPIGYPTNTSTLNEESENTSHKVQDPLSDSTPTMNSSEARVLTDDLIMLLQKFCENATD